MFQSLFQVLVNGLPRNAVVTGIQMRWMDGEQAFVKADGVSNEDFARTVGQMQSRGWSVEKVIWTLDRTPRNAYRTHAAYVKA